MPRSLALVLDPRRSQQQPRRAPTHNDGDHPRLRAFQFLLETHSLAPLLGTQDLRWLSLCRRDFRPFERQITSLRPRAAHEPASPLLARLQQRAGWLRDGVVRGLWGEVWLVGEALSAAALRRHAAKRHRKEGGWDTFLDAVEAGRVSGLEQLDFRVEYDDLKCRPRLPIPPALRLAQGLRFLPHLLDLDLEGCKIGSAGAVALADGFQHTPRLRSLSLHNVHIGDMGMVALAAALPRIPELKELRLGCCRFGQVGLAALAGQLRHLQQLRSLRVIQFVGCGSAQRATLDLFLCELRRLPHLECLCLTSPHLHDESVVVLAGMLRFLPKLRMLALQSERLCDDGVEAIAAVLPCLPNSASSTCIRILSRRGPGAC